MVILTHHVTTYQSTNGNPFYNKLQELKDKVTQVLSKRRFYTQWDEEFEIKRVIEEGILNSQMPKETVEHRWFWSSAKSGLDDTNKKISNMYIEAEKQA